MWIPSSTFGLSVDVEYSRIIACSLIRVIGRLKSLPDFVLFTTFKLFEIRYFSYYNTNQSLMYFTFATSSSFRMKG